MITSWWLPDGIQHITVITTGTHSGTALSIQATILLETRLSLSACKMRQSFCKLKCSSLPSCADAALQHYALLMVWTTNLGIRAFASACSIYSINSFRIFFALKFPLLTKRITSLEKIKIKRLRWFNCQNFRSLISHESSKFISNSRYLFGTLRWLE